MSRKIIHMSTMIFQGLGETRKSTPTPLEVKKLEGIYIEQISCGMCHTVMIARDETDEEKERIAALPSYNPQEGKLQCP